MFPSRLSPLLWLAAAFLVALPARGAEPFLHANDVVAFIGGEDFVTAAEQGELELRLTLSHPGVPLKFRSLAWEGDTVFTQRRDLNYPALDDQLERVAATVVVTNFGALESLSGAGKLPEFIAAYEALLDRLSAGGKRRLALIAPPPFEQTPGVPLDRSESNRTLRAYVEAIAALAQRRHCALVNPWDAAAAEPMGRRLTRDGLHLNPEGHRLLAAAVAAQFRSEPPEVHPPPGAQGKMLRLIREKNQLWFNYYRPENWAFLAGDRTNQPSSRDHIDPSIRWFPAEMEKYLPLIAAKESEIAAAATTSAAP